MQDVQDIRFAAPAPTPVTVCTAETVGSPGIATVYYWIVALFPIGKVISRPVMLRNAPNVLDAHNYVHLSWQSDLPASHYDVLVTATPHLPAEPGLHPIALAQGLAATEFLDQGQGLASYNLAGLSNGAPALAHVYFNNQDFDRPTLQFLMAQVAVTQLMFPDGSTQGSAPNINAAQTPWLSDIDAAQHSLLNCASIRGGGTLNPFLNLGGAFPTLGGLNIQMTPQAGGRFTVFTPGNSISPSIMVANNTGVGIMNTLPAAFALDVVGDVNVTGIYRVNGVAAGGQTPWVSAINGANFPLNNCGAVRINASAPIQGASVLTAVAASGFYVAELQNTSATGAATLVLYNDFSNSTTFGCSGSSVSGDRASGGYISTQQSKLLLQVGNANAPCVWCSFVGSNDTRIGVNKTVASGVPAYTVDVVGDVNVSGVYRVGGVALAASQTPWTQNINAASFQLNTVGQIGIGAASSTSWSIYAYNANAGGQAGAVFNNSAGNSMSVGCGGPSFGAPWASNAFLGSATNIVFVMSGTERVRVTNAGLVGIGLTPTHQLQLSTDDAAKLTTNTWAIASDIRTKRNVQRFEGDIEVIRKLDPIVAEYNGLGGTIDGMRVVSFDAAELREIVPPCVTSVRGKLREKDAKETDLLCVNTHELFFHMIRAVQELDRRIAELEPAPAAKHANHKRSTHK